MKPLYRFYFDDNKMVCVDEISEYEDGRGHYKYVMPNGYRKYVYKRNIDKIVRMELYSFNGNLENAYMILRKDIKKKMDKAKADYHKYSKILLSMR